jgi:DNA (cytosine-5)-methyltransferase 1
MSWKRYKFIDLFAGIGGIRIPFDRFNGDCVFSSEIDESCQIAYEANFGEKPYGDITKIAPKAVPDHDILLGGFPCQAFSIIGRQKGFADTRGTLFFNIEEILRIKRPRAFLLENVKQLYTHDGGRTYEVIQKRLRDLGYRVHTKILNALDFGVPQKRERTYIAGFLDDLDFSFPTDGKLYNLADVLEDERDVAKQYYASDYIVKKRRIAVKGAPPTPSVWHENKSGNISVLPYSCALRAFASYNYLLVNGYRRPTEREMLRLQGFPDNFKIVVNYSQTRRQAGNSVTVPVIEAIAKNMLTTMGYSNAG